MSNADTTERRLLASIRKAKGEDDAPAPRPRRTAAPRAASKPARIPATSPAVAPKGADPFQAAPRVWPD
jgi:hypothetical protein